MIDALVGRQPIFDRRLDVIGYELLFRGHDTDHARVVDADQATTQTILNTFLEIGLDQIVGKEPAFINLTRSFILEELPLPFPPDQVVLEVLEDITVDRELISALQDLSNRGYRIALDDVVNPYDLRPLLPIAHIVKLDLLAIDRTKIAPYAAFLRQYKVKLLAEKVETPQMQNMCQRLGFDYFQGYFLCRPMLVKGQRIPTSRLALLRLLAKLQDPDMEFRELEQIIGQDASLGYKLLRLINSAYYSLRAEVASIHQALTLLGIKSIQSWVSLILLAEIDDKPRELLTIAMIRAKMCELLAQALKMRNEETFFLVGLFSVLDAMLDLPMEKVLKSLPLTDEIVRALLKNEGKLGKVLQHVLMYERGEWDKIEQFGIEIRPLRNAYLESLKWARAVSGELGL